MALPFLAHDLEQSITSPGFSSLILKVAKTIKDHIIMSYQNPLTYVLQVHGSLWESVSLKTIWEFPVNSKSSWIYIWQGYPVDPWLLSMGTHCEVGSKQWGKRRPQKPFPETHTVDPGYYFSNDLLHSGCCSETGSYLKIIGSQAGRHISLTWGR